MAHGPTRLAGLVEALQRPDAFDHPVSRFEVRETHISYVLLTGPYAYKLKKPVDLGFLDFSTLAKREHYCREELRLNRRLAPDLYLDVVPVTGTRDRPVVGSGGEPLEFAVKMRQFPADAQLDRLLAAGRLTPAHIDALATEIGDFHQRATPAAADSDLGTPAAIERQTLENFDQIPALPDGRIGARLQALRGWSADRLRALEPAFTTRRERGLVRDCHGDMHLKNIALIDGQPVIFDCIEFSEMFRWSDVISEVAFLFMDLEYRGRPALAHRFLNRYLESTGDYDGVRVLRHYLVYRAMVRSKIAHIRMGQRGLPEGERAGARDRFDRHLALAERYTETGEAPPLVITHGVSGSGKSTLTEPLLELIGAVRVRSDVERRRLDRAGAVGPTGRGLETGRYAAGATEATYRRLSIAAGEILRGGLPAIVDATFLERDQRRRFADLARDLHCPFFVLDLQADPDTLADRVAARQRRGGDPSEATVAVLDHQRGTVEPCHDAEPGRRLVIDSTRELDLPAVAARIRGTPAVAGAAP